MSQHDSVLEAAAANRDVQPEPGGPFQDCEDVVHISVYFDGTGNNRDEDHESKRWSNVARIFESALDDPKRSIYRIYVAGVGTTFNGEADGWLSQASAWAEDRVGGLAFGAGGDRRMEFGDLTVNRRLRDVLISNALRLGGEAAQYAREGTDKSFADVNRALGKHRLIKVINLSVFGFSRGAALARAFTNRVLDACQSKDGELTYGGYPIRFTFMGVFDTVASFGVPAQNVRTPFSERDLRVPRVVERCVHFVAGHEVRFAFPVDLIRLEGKLAGDWIEKTYPGVHSDVGGGYEPDAQKIDNNYARIPMRDMMGEALATGVRLFSYETLRRDFAGTFMERFECKEQTELAYQGYMAVFGAAAGPVEEQIKRHMNLLYSAYGTMHRRGMETAGARSRGQSALKNIGPKGMAWEVEKYRAAARVGEWMRFGGTVANAYAQYVKPEEWQLEAWDSSSPEGVLQFVATYVHDSKVDFVMNAEPFSYFKARGIEESTASVWQDARAWTQAKGAEVSEAAGSAYRTASAHVEEAARAAGRHLKSAREGAERIIDAGVSWVRDTATDLFGKNEPNK